MTLGGSLTGVVSKGAESLICNALQIKSFRDLGISESIVTKGSAPTNDSASSSPGKIGVFLINTANNAVYLCYDFTDTTDHKWCLIAETA